MTTSIDADRYDEWGRERSGSGESHSGQVRMAYRLAQSHADELLFVNGIGWHFWGSPDMNVGQRRCGMGGVAGWGWRTGSP